MSEWKSVWLTALLMVLGDRAVAQQLLVGPSLQDAEPTSVWIMFEVSSAFPGQIEYGPTATLGMTAGTSQTTSQNGARIHHGQITGLSPDSTYFYRVRSGAATSPTFSFRTPALASAEKPFRFAAYSDCQGNGSHPAKHTEIVNEGVIDFVTEQFGGSLPDELAFVIVPGDLVDAGSVYEQWKAQFFDEAKNINTLVPYYPALGNHEQNSHWYFDYFRLPQNGTPGFEEHWYFKDHGNLRLIGLDSNGGYRVQAQLDWLDGVLADAAANDAIDFVFAQLHHPHLSELWSVGNTDYTGEVVRRLEAFSTASGKPSAHFFGHTHGYERGQSRDHDHLWVNVAAGEGAIDYWGLVPVADYDEIQKSFPDWGFVIVEVEAGADPTFRLRRVSRGNEQELKDNVVMDDVTIRRYSTKPSTPSPALPADGASGVDPLFAELHGGAFADTNAAEFHAESHFQLTTTPGDWSEPVDVWVRYENWAAPEGASGRANGWYSVNTVADSDVTRAVAPRLLPETAYEWRVRYRDSGLTWSDWSASRAFVTGPLPVGACCLPGGGCSSMIEADCLALDGSFAGVGVQCEDAACPEVVTLFAEGFDGVSLGANVDEGVAGSAVWTETPPAGWTIDDSGVPTGGVTEWRGWAFTTPAWWAQVAGDQGRSGFARSSGVIAVADPDEWDDATHAAGTYNALMTTPTIEVAMAEAETVRLVVDSSWLPSGGQRGEVRLSVDGGAFTTIQAFSSAAGADFKPASPDETLVIPLGLTPGARSVRVQFALLNAGNDWWWAIDNVRVLGSPAGVSRPRTQIFGEDFEGLPLGPNVDEALAGSAVWTDTPPAGWTIDESGVPSIGVAGQGVTEWEGWAFTDRAWWTQAAGDQRRSEFTRGVGTVAVADPDEWDDLGNPDALGAYTTELWTPAIPVAGLWRDSMRVRFDSSWRPEGIQRAELRAEYSNAADLVLLDWRSTAGALFKPDATNEVVEVAVPIPAGSSEVELVFTLADARNNWWWAIDNVSLTASCVADVAPEHGRLDVNDIIEFVTAFNDAELTADVAPQPAGDGALNVNDIIDFVTAFNAGCPG